MNTNENNLFNKANTLLESGQINPALKILSQLNQTQPKTPLYISKIGTCYARAGNRAKALEFFEEALQIDQSFASALANASLIYAQQGQYLKALPLVDRGLKSDPNMLELYSTKSFILKHLNRMNEAIRTLQAGINIFPNDIDLKLNLSGLFIENNHKDEAKSILKEIINSSDNFEAHYILSSISSYKDNENLEHIKKMEELAKALKNNAPSSESLFFALGRAYESKKDYQTSFKNYQKANEIRRSQFQYDVEKAQTFLLSAQKIFSKDFVSKNKANNCEFNPIFIIGMPRSGTSLVEQILSSHSKVYGAGELSNIQNDFTHFIQLQKQRDFDSTLFQSYQDNYLAHLKDQLNGQIYFTDKMPMNFRFLGFVKCVFPDAKIIYCDRNPLDVALSIFKKKFSGHIPYAYSLEEIIKFYNQHLEIMENWKAIIEQDILSLNYENLVNSPKGKIREILNFCELEFEENCLQFHKNKRSVTTASTQQVRQPIYSSSINYWKNYAFALEDFKDQFEE
ncbi:MAG: sulfotransferase [Pseudomonadota bacterium]